MIIDASVLWTKSLQGRLRGLSLAREHGWMLAWDKRHWLYLLNPDGVVQAQVHVDEQVVAAAISEDGSSLAVVGQNGLVRGVNPDLSTRWQRVLNVSPLALAWEPLGAFLGLTDSKGGVHLFSRDGNLVGQFQTPRPLHHLAFVPGAPHMVGSADYGLVGAFDAKGTWVWRDAPVIHTGSMTVSGDGATLLLACFSEGLQQYGPKGQRMKPLIIPEPCPLAGVSYAGDLLVSAGMGKTLYFLEPGGKLLSHKGLEKPVQALALSALGDSVYLVTKDGELARLAISRNASI